MWVDGKGGMSPVSSFHFIILNVRSEAYAQKKTGYRKILYLFLFELEL